MSKQTKVRAAVESTLVELLEPRQLMCVEHMVNGLLMESSPFLPTKPSGFTVAASGPSSPTVPALASRPGATAKLYLDFDGGASMTWGSFSVPATPKYDTDNNTADFSAGELASIQNIFNRVAEKFSPFNIDVTTIDPGNLTDGVTLRALIGGNGSWYGSAGGVAYVGGFTNSAPNTAFIFPKMLANGDVKYTSEAIAHEAGHGFGLQHQSKYSGTSKTAEYNPGTSASAPIMGNSYSATRAMWWYGQSSVSSSTYQDDSGVLANNTNGFGLRSDDTGNVIGSASAVTVETNDISASGVIETKTDVDIYSFSTLTGAVSITLSPSGYGGMLDTKLTLLSSVGTTIATANTSSLSETISTNLSAGQYYLVVAGAGTAGDLGQYSITGTIVNDPNYVAAPASLTGTASGGAVNLSWTDMSPNETGFVISRSSDGGETWAEVATNDANDSTLTDSDVTVGTAYSYRVYATGETADSGNSNVATVNVTPATPATPTLGTVGTNSIILNWTSVDGATGYKIERSLNGTTWTALVTLGDVATYTNSGLTAATKYYYRVKASSAVGDSSASTSIASFTKCVAPTALTGKSAATSIALSWTNVAGETGYKLERSLDGETWSTLATKTLNVVAHTDSSLTAGTEYYYRVRAVNSAGDSDPTLLTKTTLLNAPAGLTAAGEGATTANLSWTDGDGESAYKVERLNGTTWLLIATLDADADSYEATGLLAGKAYSFRIKAVNAGGDSTPSATATTNTAPAIAVVTLTSLTVDSIKLAWPNLAYNNGYEVERSADGADWEQIATPVKNAITFSDTALETNTLYYYRVRGVNDAGNGEFSVAKSTKSLMDAPTGLEATPFSAAQINLAWEDSDGETGYRIERQSGTSWVTVAETTADTTSYSVLKLSAGTTNTFRIRAKNAGGVSLPSTTDAAITLPGKVGVVTPTVLGHSSIKLTWGNLTGNAGYEIQQSMDGSTWGDAVSTSTGVANYTVTGLTENTLYYYRVRAVNASGNGEYSTIISKRTLLPTPANVAAEADSATQVTVSWDDSEGETGYKLERKTGATTWALVATLPAGTTSRAVTALKAGTAYTFRVSALSLGGTSAATSVSVTTPPAAPALSLTALPNGNTLNWKNVTGETGYQLQYSTNHGSTWSLLANVGADVTSFFHSTRNPALYTYRVIAFNASGSSLPSA